jgi:hypothetical protein
MSALYWDDDTPLSRLSPELLLYALAYLTAWACAALTAWGVVRVGVWALGKGWTR